MGLSPAERTRLWRAERQRLGLVKLELWAPPSAKADILAAARAIVTASSRGPALLKNPDPPQGSFQMDHVIDTDWSVKSLADALSETRLLRDGELTARVLEGTEPVLQITMHEFGDLPIYRRFWFGDTDARQDPVSFWESVYDDRAARDARRIYQTCMLFARDLPGEGRELLLALEMEPEGGDLTHEVMVGIPLDIGEFEA